MSADSSSSRPVVDFDPDNPLPSQTVLWRYMSLGAFFSLLDGFAFLPSVARLRQDDQMEGEPFDSAAPDIVRAWGNNSASLKAWLTRKTEIWEREREQANPSAGCPANDELLVSIWSRELAKRRAVWCWHESGDESFGMWSVYAHRGIAVQTTLEALRLALPATYEFKIARMNVRERYSPADPKHARYLLHPFLLKGVEFKSENEVRVFTRCAPATDVSGLPVFGIEAAKLLHAVRLSPRIPFAEAESLTKIIQARCPNIHIKRSSTLGFHRNLEGWNHRRLEAGAKEDPSLLSQENEPIPSQLTEL